MQQTDAHKWLKLWSLVFPQSENNDWIVMEQVPAQLLFQTLSDHICQQVTDQLCGITELFDKKKMLMGYQEFKRALASAWMAMVTRCASLAQSPLPHLRSNLIHLSAKMYSAIYQIRELSRLIYRLFRHYIHSRKRWGSSGRRQCAS